MSRVDYCVDILAAAAFKLDQERFVNQKAWPDCLRHANAVLDRKPTTARSRTMRGRARCETGDAEAGIEDLDRAVRDGPDIAAVRNQRAIVFGKMGRPDLRIEDSRIALRHAPGDSGILHHLGVMLAKTGQAEEVLGIFTDLVSRHTEADDRAWRGECHRLLGNLPGAIADFEHPLTMEGVSDEDATWINEKFDIARKAQGKAWHPAPATFTGRDQ